MRRAEMGKALSEGVGVINGCEVGAICGERGPEVENAKLPEGAKAEDGMWV
jgi:hypothetical protein